MNLLSRAKRIARGKGMWRLIRGGYSTACSKGAMFFSYIGKKLQLPSEFLFQNKKYRYFFHLYNTTWMNERAVELPIIWKEVAESGERRVLEVGNVLSHYFPVHHEVIDKYECGSGVINQDVCEFRSATTYDLIVSISTIEHVGWDEVPREDTKAVRAIENLKRLLAPNGRLIVTLPLGYNPNIDALLRSNGLGFTKTSYLKRVSEDNTWAEVVLDDIQGTKYGFPFKSANALVIGFIDRGDRGE